jgi:hypothetical protein
MVCRCDHIEGLTNPLDIYIGVIGVEDGIPVGAVTLVTPGTRPGACSRGTTKRNNYEHSQPKPSIIHI